MTWLLSALSLLSAFLLFQVQPVISKFILPWFGGSPGVWTTCMLFFQCVLFAGYAYAHGLMMLPRRWQFIVHGVLVVAAAVVLPIAPSESWKPSGSEDPTGRILLLLLASVGLPYFVLSSTSPLVQVWFSRAVPGGKPWRLYALSNIGSLTALISYPFFFEPRWDVMQQTTRWSVVFVLFALLCVFSLWRDSKSDHDEEAHAAAKAASTPAAWRRLLWVLLPAMASMLLLATTNHVCTDVAVIPFLWVVPLSLYLLTFIICFEHERWYRPALWALPAMLLLFLAATYSGVFDNLAEHFGDGSIKKTLQLMDDEMGDFRWQLIICFGAMFLGCMVCHGELSRIKPDPAHLTEFYLLMSAGGAIGGLLVSLAAPHLFTTYLEWPICLLVCFAIAAVVVTRSAWRVRIKPVRMVFASVGVATLVAGPLFMQKFAFDLEDRLLRVRNFYGAVSVQKEWDDEDGADIMRFHHGGITHGIQVLSPALQQEPTSYYGRKAGIGLALSQLKDKPDARVGVVGMGTATVAAYGQRGHNFRFYEINPAVPLIARQYFTYMSDMEKRGGTLDVIMGDARLSMEREAPQQFDVLLLDAFSGDSVPVHLLTRDAFEIYLKHMKPNGIIAVHVTNRYLVLAPVVEKVAASLGLKTTRIVNDPEGDLDYTDYVLVTNDEAFLAANPPFTEDSRSDTKVNASLWTDKSYNLYQILDTD